MNGLIHQMPPTITPAGMSAERQHYLYEKIRPFCSSEEAAALTCSRPASQPVERTTQLRESKIKSTRKCSHCHKPGHTKTVRGKISCPELLKIGLEFAFSTIFTQIYTDFELYPFSWCCFGVYLYLNLNLTSLLCLP